MTMGFMPRIDQMVVDKLFLLHGGSHKADEAKIVNHSGDAPSILVDYVQRIVGEEGLTGSCDFEVVAYTSSTDI